MCGPANLRPARSRTRTSAGGGGSREGRGGGPSGCGSGREVECMSRAVPIAFFDETNCALPPQFRRSAPGSRSNSSISPRRPPRASVLDLGCGSDATRSLAKQGEPRTGGDFNKRVYGRDFTAAARSRRGRLGGVGAATCGRWRSTGFAPPRLLHSSILLGRGEQRVLASSRGRCDNRPLHARHDEPRPGCSPTPRSGRGRRARTADPNGGGLADPRDLEGAVAPADPAEGMPGTRSRPARYTARSCPRSWPPRLGSATCGAARTLRVLDRPRRLVMLAGGHRLADGR